MSSSLLRRGYIALKWNYFGILIRVLLQVVAQVIIARIIGPSAFGAAMAAIFVITIAALIAEGGMGASVIHKELITTNDLKSIFLFILITTTISGVILYIFSDKIAEFWQASEVSLLIKLLIFSLVFQSLGIISLALLRKELNFKWIQISQLSGYSIGFLLVGVVSAYYGMGALSLIYALIVQNLITTLLLFIKASYPLDCIISGKLVEVKIFNYGLKVLITNLSNWAIENIDRLMIGKAFGTVALGAYTASYNLVRTPTNHLVSSLQQILFPASVKLKDSPRKQEIIYLSFVWGVSILVFPLFFSMGILSDLIVSVLYGAEWKLAAEVLLPLSIAMPFHALMAIAGPILWGNDKVKAEMQIQFFTSILLMILLMFLANLSILWMAWGVSFIYILRAVWMQWQLGRAINLVPQEFLISFYPGLIVGVIFAGVFFVSDSIFIKNFTNYQRVFFIIMEGAILMLLAMLSLKVLFPVRLRSELSAAAIHLPWIARKILGFPRNN